MDERINRLKLELEFLGLEEFLARLDRQRRQLDAFAKTVDKYAHYANREIPDGVGASLGASEIKAIDEYFESQQGRL